MLWSPDSMLAGRDGVSDLLRPQIRLSLEGSTLIARVEGRPTPIDVAIDGAVDFSLKGLRWEAVRVELWVDPLATFTDVDADREVGDIGGSLDEPIRLLVPLTCCLDP